jgi:hypothetical protein
MAMKFRYGILLLLTMLIACEEAVDKPVLSQNENLLAVEGVLTNENRSHSVTLSFPYQSLNGQAIPATGALVQIMQGATTYMLTESPAGSGVYQTPVFRAVFDAVYTLHILHQGKEYFAQDSSIPVEPLAAIEYRKVNSQYQLVLNTTGSSANYVDHSIDWKNTAACTSNTCEGRIVFYDLKTIDVNEIYKPAKEDFLFPVNATIIRRKYSASPAYRAFLRSVLSETEWRGGIFDVERANTATNLSAGAIGFFAVTTVVSDTTVVVE